MDTPPVIFSEGISITYHLDDTFSVVDIATGFPVGAVKDIRLVTDADSDHYLSMIVEFEGMKFRGTLNGESITLTSAPAAEETE